MNKISLILAGMLFGAQALAATCPTGTTSAQGLVDSKPICNIEGTYKNNDLVLTPDIAWVLKGDVRIGGDKKDNSSLTIEAGTYVYGAPNSFITITRDSKIFVKGTASKPVVFTALERQNPTVGYWGGIVVTGNARINACNKALNNGFCEGFIEGVASDVAPKYGGTNDDDNSGSIEFLRIEYAGYTIAPDSELNGITFYGVGRGTKVEYVEAYKGADDGVELFGGTVNLKYIVSIDNDDDGFDWDQGWTGSVQFLYIVMDNASEKDPSGIEADNNRDNHAATPRSNPTLSNVTIIGRGTNPALLNGIMLRRGTGAQFYNTVVTGQFKACFNIDDPETFNNGGKVVGSVVEQTGIVMENSIIQCNNAPFGSDAKDVWDTASWFTNISNANNFVMAPTEDVLADGEVPVANGPAVKTGFTPPSEVYPGNFEFLQVDYVGAFSSSKSAKWTDGWTVLK